MRNKYSFAVKQVGKYTVKVVEDSNPCDPRLEWDNFGKMICFHRRYNLGDKHNFTVDELKDYLEENKDKILWLPLYLYDHSGITMNTSGFSCPWDSGQVGVIMIEKSKILEEFGGKRVTKKLRERAYNILKDEVEIYDNYLTGEVYGFVVSDGEDDNIDSCWGFYGDVDYCLSEGVEAAKWLIHQDIKNHIEKVKTWIRNKVPLQNRSPLSIV